jgi:hypothetical protein
MSLRLTFYKTKMTTKAYSVIAFAVICLNQIFRLAFFLTIALRCHVQQLSPNSPKKTFYEMTRRGHLFYV